MATGGQSRMINGVSYSTQPLGNYTNASYNYNGQQLYRYTDQPNQKTTVSLTPSAPANNGGGGGGYTPPPPSGYGRDPNFNYSGWGQDFGTGDAAKAAYEAYPGQVDEAFKGVFDTFNQMSDAELANRGNLEQLAMGGYEGNKALLNQAYTSGVANDDRERGAEQTRGANAIADARQLYGELQQGVKQRFGGSSSAGEFADAFYGREAQKQQGNIQNTVGQNIQKLVAHAQDLKSKFDAQLVDLEDKKNTALAQARDTFTQRIQQINGLKATAEQNKAQMKLQALQELRQNAMAVQNSWTQLHQTLIAQQQSADLNLRNAIQSYSAQAGTTPQLGTYAKANAPLIGGGQGATSGYQASQLYGGYGGKKDQYGNPI